MKIKLEMPDSDEGYLLEFFDQTIDSLNVYVRHQEEAAFREYMMGDHYAFNEKPLAHKNFQIHLSEKGAYLTYFRVASHEYADIRVAIRSYNRFVGYAGSIQKSVDLIRKVIL